MLLPATSNVLVALDRQIALLQGVVHLAGGKHGALGQFAAGARIASYRVEGLGSFLETALPAQGDSQEKGGDRRFGKRIFLLLYS